MNVSEHQWGPRLYTYLERQWLAQGMTRAEWAREHKFEPSLFARWQHGEVVPSLRQMTAVADALRIPLLDVLIIAGVVGEKDAGRKPAEAPAVPTLDAALAADPDPLLLPEDRENIRALAASIRKVRGELAGKRRR